jgi:type IV pilus assembly protein PilE
MKLKLRGITLIELMVVVVVISILAAIAIPSYRRYVIRANRTDAKTALLSVSQNLERCFTNSTPYAYNSAVCAAAVPLPFNEPAGNYRISGVLAANTYTLTATPQGTQVQDTQCANFVVTQAGQQTVSGTLSATPEACWRR